MASPPSIPSLREPIISILRLSDLSSISAKRVRAELASRFPSLDVKANKAAIDDLIRECFDDLNGEEEANDDESAKVVSTKEAQMDRPTSNGLALPGPGVVHRPSASPASTSTASSAPSATKPSPKGKSRGESATITDEELARQLQADFNRPSTRGGGQGGSTRRKAVPSGGKAKGSLKKRKASAATVNSSGSEAEEDGEGEDGREPRPAKKKARGPNPNNPFNRPLVLSPQLAELLGETELPRPQVVKKLWEYIRAHKLQDKRDIICDDKFQEVFGQTRMTCFSMNKYLKNHLKRKEDLIDSTA